MFLQTGGLFSCWAVGKLIIYSRLISNTLSQTADNSSDAVKLMWWTIYFLFALRIWLKVTGKQEGDMDRLLRPNGTDTTRYWTRSRPSLESLVGEQKRTGRVDISVFPVCQTCLQRVIVRELWDCCSWILCLVITSNSALVLLDRNVLQFDFSGLVHLFTFNLWRSEYHTWKWIAGEQLSKSNYPHDFSLRVEGFRIPNYIWTCDCLCFGHSNWRISSFCR